MTTQKPIDFTKPVRTRDGRAVTILTTSARGKYAVLGNIEGDDVTDSWTLTGCNNVSLSGDKPNDLINVPQKYRVWANCYRPNSIGVDTLRTHGSRESADRYPGDRVACIEIEFAEGQGL